MFHTFGKGCGIIPCMKQKTVLVALKMAVSAGQSKLAGIFRYLGERYQKDSPWDIHLVRTYVEFTREAVEAAIAKGTDGFILSIPGTHEAFAPLAEVATPTVVMDIPHATLERRRENFVAIFNSGEEIGVVAANYLMGQGVAREYAYLHPKEPTDWSKVRFEAFRNCLRDNGLWCVELSSPEQVARLKRPAAVFAANDDRAHDLIAYLEKRHIKVPKDIAVLGVDNDALICDNIRPRLSSVQPDFEGEGYRAAELLDAMMRGEPPPEHAVKASVKTIVRRESTAELSHSGRLVQKALAYIDRHALEGIGVADVVAHLKCSRRLADLRFRELQHRSILQAIIERRMDEVRRRLRETRDKLSVIAEECGYPNVNYLANLFRRRYSMSMTDFRRAAGKSGSEPNRGQSPLF